MRELKFRVWDKLAERFILPDKGFQGHYILDLNGHFYDLHNGSGGDEYVVQQYTGLKDKNGKEIYEGDIVQYYYNDSSVKWVDTVVWQHYGWQLFHLDGTESGFAPLSFNPALEIIGNIFETPELLK